MSAPVLLVESDDLLRESLGRALRSEGFDVLTVSDCEQARARLAGGRVFAILLDLDLPGDDGWVEARRLTSLRPARPLLAITARTGQERRAAEEGVDVLMEKPLSVPSLVETMKQLLDKALEGQALLRQRAGALGVGLPASPAPGLTLDTI